MDKTQARKSFIPDPEYDPPYKFYQTIDSLSPTKKKYVPKTVNPPTYELINHRKRTDTCQVKMETTTGRDNAMYRITDSWNLDAEHNQPPEGIICDRHEIHQESTSNRYVEKAQESLLSSNYQATIVPSTATHNKRQSIFHPLYSITDRLEASTASESTRRHVVK